MSAAWNCLLSLISAGDFSVARSSALKHSGLFRLSSTFSFNSFPLEAKAGSSGAWDSEWGPAQPRCSRGSGRVPRDGSTHVFAPSHVPQASQEEQPGGFM